MFGEGRLKTSLGYTSFPRDEALLARMRPTPMPYIVHYHFLTACRPSIWRKRQSSWRDNPSEANAEESANQLQ